MRRIVPFAPSRRTFNGVDLSLELESVGADRIVGAKVLYTHQFDYGLEVTSVQRGFQEPRYTIMNNMDSAVLGGQRKWFKDEMKLPHRGYLPSPGGLPQSVASEAECVARWGERKGRNGFRVNNSYANYDALKARYEQVHQRPMGPTIPLYFALGWVAEEKHGASAIDWATFACWRSNNHDGPFEELSDRLARLSEDERQRVEAGSPKARGRPSRQTRDFQINKETSGSESKRVHDNPDTVGALESATGENQPLSLPLKRSTAKQQRKGPKRLCSRRFGGTVNPEKDGSASPETGPKHSPENDSSLQTDRGYLNDGEEVLGNKEDDVGQEDGGTIAVAADAVPRKNFPKPVSGYCSIRFHEENPHARDKYKDGGCPFRLSEKTTDLTDAQSDEEDDTDEYSEGQQEEEIVAPVAADAVPAQVIQEPVRGYCSIRFHEENPHAREKYKNGGCPFKISEDTTAITDIERDVDDDPHGISDDEVNGENGMKNQIEDGVMGDISSTEQGIRDITDNIIQKVAENMEVDGEKFQEGDESSDDAEMYEPLELVNRYRPSANSGDSSTPAHTRREITKLEQWEMSAGLVPNQGVGETSEQAWRSPAKWTGTPFEMSTLSETSTPEVTPQVHEQDDTMESEDDYVYIFGADTNRVGDEGEAGTASTLD